MTQPKEPQTVFPDIGNRGGALLLDLFLLAVVPAPGPYVLPVIAFLYFAGMPLTPMQGTLGKWSCRIKLCDRAGRRLEWRASALRAGATMLWLAVPFVLNDLQPVGGVSGAALASWWWIVFALPWAPASFLPRRESLFDRLAGTLVVRYRADTESIASAEPAQKASVVHAAVTILLFLVAGVAISTGTLTYHNMNLRARVFYAYSQTDELRQKVDAFQEREKRWPTALELGVPEWTPYRDGGGYRLHADGSIAITFAVLPELKGHSLTLRPTRPAGRGKVQWQCSADAEFERGYLPASCR